VTFFPSRLSGRFRSTPGIAAAARRRRPDLLGNPYLTGYHAAGPSGIAHRYLNPAAFTLPTGAHVIPLISGIQVRDGDLTRNAIRNIGQYDFDLSVAKGIPLSEGRRLDFRIDAFDVLNHMNFTGLGANTNVSTFGFFTPATPRSIQLGGKFSF
jgi:hypothetical protein